VNDQYRYQVQVLDIGDIGKVEVIGLSVIVADPIR